MSRNGRSYLRVGGLFIPPYIYRKIATAGTNYLTYQGTLSKSNPEYILSIVVKNVTKGLESVYIYLQDTGTQQIALIDHGSSTAGFRARFKPFHLWSPYQVKVTMYACDLADTIELMMVIE